MLEHAVSMCHLLMQIATHKCCGCVAMIYRVSDCQRIIASLPEILYPQLGYPQLCGEGFRVAFSKYPVSPQIPQRTHSERNGKLILIYDAMQVAKYTPGKCRLPFVEKLSLLLVSRSERCSHLGVTIGS